jgi:hypothetical protein
MCTVHNESTNVGPPSPQFVQLIVTISGDESPIGDKPNRAEHNAMGSVIAATLSLSRRHGPIIRSALLVKRRRYGLVGRRTMTKAFFLLSVFCGAASLRRACLPEFEYQKQNLRHCCAGKLSFMVSMSSAGRKSPDND